MVDLVPYGSTISNWIMVIVGMVAILFLPFSGLLLLIDRLSTSRFSRNTIITLLVVIMSAGTVWVVHDHYSSLSSARVLSISELETQSGTMILTKYYDGADRMNGDTDKLIVDKGTTINDVLYMMDGKLYCDGRIAIKDNQAGLYANYDGTWVLLTTDKTRK
jgi:hypothetical protein